MDGFFFFFNFLFLRLIFLLKSFSKKEFFFPQILWSWYDLRQESLYSSAYHMFSKLITCVGKTFHDVVEGVFFFLTNLCAPCHNASKYTVVLLARWSVDFQAPLLTLLVFLRLTEAVWVWIPWRFLRSLSPDCRFFRVSSCPRGRFLRKICHLCRTYLRLSMAQTFSGGPVVFPLVI